MSFEDGLKLVKLRGESMQAAADAAKSGMVSVIGLDSDKVAALCEAATKEVRRGEKSRVCGVYVVCTCVRVGGGGGQAKQRGRQELEGWM
jgi:hypothetical protein